MQLTKPFVILFFLFLTSCTNLLYYPNSYRYVNEKKLDHVPTEVELDTEENKNLLSWYFEASKNRLPITIIFSHGNGQNMSAHFRSLYWILQDELNFFIVGYPGYGPNEGTPTPKSTVQTVLAAISWVKKNKPNDAIFIFGQSLGGNIALRALSDSDNKNICGIAVEGTFLSYRKAAQKTLAKKWFLWPFQWLSYVLIDDTYSIKNNLSKLEKNNYLVIHGKKDPSIPFELGEELYNKLPQTKLLWINEEGKHIDTFFKNNQRRKDFVKFIKKSCL